MGAETTPSPAARAVDIMIRAKQMRMPLVEPWWRWTVVLACSMACRRIENITAGRGDNFERKP